MHREYSEACYYGSLGTDLSVERRQPHSCGLFRRGRGKKRPLPVRAAVLLTARGCCYFAAGDLTLGLASELLSGPPGAGAALLFMLFGDAALMPLSEPVAPGVP